MTDVSSKLLVTQFRRALHDCDRLYRHAGRLVSQQHPELISQSPAQFVELMRDLQKGLVVKLFIEVAEADRKWAGAESMLAQELFRHAWQRDLSGEALREAVRHVSMQAVNLTWYSLVRPYAQIAPLRRYVGDIEAVIMRLANLIARADGRLSVGETAMLRSLQHELDCHLRPLDLDAPGKHEQAIASGTSAVEHLREDASQTRAACELQETDDIQATPTSRPSRKERLKEALSELDGLIGLETVKQEVRTLTNYLRMQSKRQSMGLPETSISLHMVFEGNPGSGKTTVARIIGQILGAMGILRKGHVLETDRSGLVAEYAGQTGPKTNKKIDEALDGVLFVDEAYSLVADSGADAYGNEAIQTLLKRMEDDRRRLVVILAGYPEPMDRLLCSNPGLSSRFQKRLVFPDYTTNDLCRIFASMCSEAHFTLPPEVRAKLLIGFGWLYDHRDEHFGNGRLVRNTFENAIRRLSNRVAGVSDLTKELLTCLHAEDIEMAEVASERWRVLDGDELLFQTICHGCKTRSHIPMDYLGRRLKCNSCGARFVAEWGDPVDAEK